MQQREGLKSRLGFILLSAGCAIGIGNIWRFPYVVGNNGGGIFVLFYLGFLMIMAIPVLTMEFSVGRASQKSILCAYRTLEPKGSKWHLFGGIGLAGNYLLMMFYTCVAGWMLYYCYQFIIGAFDGLDQEAVQNSFQNMLGQPWTMFLWMAIIVVLGFLVCGIGLQNGVERITKVMMLCLLGLILVLAVNSILLEGGGAGLQFYLVPNLDSIGKKGLFSVITAAMNQAFFTLSLGVGSMMIFGSYIKKDRALLGESLTVAGLDTAVAILAGLIIFPACFAFGVEPDAGPSLIFITLPNVFNAMPLGRLWGILFFLFMSFAAFSTVIAVFENIIACWVDRWHMSRRKVCIINCLLLIVLSTPCVLGFNVLSGFTPLGEGTTILDLEDFLVSNLLLPIGSLVTVLFCTFRFGWGFDAYFQEVNLGKGVKIRRWMRFYFQWILPAMILFLFGKGILDQFLK